MWINQPSTLQPLHRLHGTRVLAVQEDTHLYEIYFLSGAVVSMQVMASCLSSGWRDDDDQIQRMERRMGA